MFDLRETERLLRVDWSYGSGEDKVTGCFWFAVDGTVPAGDEKTKLTYAISDYYSDLDDGGEGRHSFPPNWGDAVDEVNFAGSGFRLLQIPEPAVSFNVDHDEVLYNKE
jgi:hypothetical protein